MYGKLSRSRLMRCFESIRDIGRGIKNKILCSIKWWMETLWYIREFQLLVMWHSERSYTHAEHFCGLAEHFQVFLDCLCSDSLQWESYAVFGLRGWAWLCCSPPFLSLGLKHKVTQCPRGSVQLYNRLSFWTSAQLKHWVARKHGLLTGTRATEEKR